MNKIIMDQLPAITITDGVSNKDADLTLPDARAAEKDNIRLFAVGVTNGVNETELAGISSEPHEKFVNYWMNPEFTSLGKIAGTIQQAVCSAVPDGKL